MVAEFESLSTSLPVEAPHAQIDTKTHQIVIQHSYVRNDRDNPMSPAEIERKLNESNRISDNILALLPRILVARNTLDNVDHSLTRDRRPLHNTRKAKSFGLVSFQGHLERRPSQLNPPRSMRD